MSDSSFVLLFDARNNLNWIDDYKPFLAATVLILIAGCYLLFKKRSAVGGALLAFFLTFGVISIFGFGASAYEYFQCKEWLDSGDYSVLVGAIENHVVDLSKRVQVESFSVDGERFVIKTAGYHCGPDYPTAYWDTELEDEMKVKLYYKNIVPVSFVYPYEPYNLILRVELEVPAAN